MINIHMEMRDIINLLNIKTINENRLENVRVEDIDAHGAIEHYDLPVNVPEDQFANVFAGTKQKFIDRFKNGSTITVYRGLIVSHDLNITKNRIGESWSWNIDGATLGSGVRYWKDQPGGDVGIVLIGEVSNEDINWETTIAVNAFEPSEAEIVIDKSAKVYVSEIVFKNGDRMAVNEWFQV